MLMDPFPCEDTFTRVPQIAARIDSILDQPEALLDDETLSQ